MLIKQNGELTYFMSDVAYHYDKKQRGYDLLIDIWGAVTMAISHVAKR